MKGGGGGLEALGSFPGKFVLFKEWAKVYFGFTFHARNI